MNGDPVLTGLAALVGGRSVETALSAIVPRVERELASKPSEPQAWDPVPLDVFGTELPDAIKSCWIFVLRDGARFGAERHPNSHQRSIALSGDAVFELLEDDVWVPHRIGASAGSDAGGRSISIPAGTWHRIRIGPENFVSLSFHTVPARELIEETPVADDLSGTRTRLYHVT